MAQQFYLFFSVLLEYLWSFHESADWSGIPSTYLLVSESFTSHRGTKLPVPYRLVPYGRIGYKTTLGLGLGILTYLHAPPKIPTSQFERTSVPFSHLVLWKRSVQVQVFRRSLFKAQDRFDRLPGRHHDTLFSKCPRWPSREASQSRYMKTILPS